MKTRSLTYSLVSFMCLSLNGTAILNAAISNNTNTLKNESNSIKEKRKPKSHQFNKQPPCCQTASYFGQCGYDSNGNPTYAYGTGMVCVEPVDANPDSRETACTVASILAQNQANNNYNSNCNQS